MNPIHIFTPYVFNNRGQHYRLIFGKWFRSIMFPDKTLSVPSRMHPKSHYISL